MKSLKALTTKLIKASTVLTTKLSNETNLEEISKLVKQKKDLHKAHDEKMAEAKKYNNLVLADQKTMEKLYRFNEREFSLNSKVNLTINNYKCDWLLSSLLRFNGYGDIKMTDNVLSKLSDFLGQNLMFKTNRKQNMLKAKSIMFNC